MRQLRADRAQQGDVSRNRFYGNAGLVSSIIYSLLHRYNVFRVLGAHDAHAIIPHTAGWMVVYDKLMAT